MSNSQPEFTLQKQVCSYIRARHPKVYFTSDAVSFLNLTMPQKARNKSIQCAGFACPDIVIFEMRGGFGGLFLELKAKSIYRADGFTMLKNPHVENQMLTIENLRQRGYRANFFWDFNKAVEEIKWYLG